MSHNRPPNRYYVRKYSVIPCTVFATVLLLMSYEEVCLFFAKPALRNVYVRLMLG